MTWKRMLSRGYFWLAVGLGVFGMFYPHMDTHVFWRTPFDYFSSADFLYFMLMPLRFGLVPLFLPMIAALPAADFIAQERRSNMDIFLVYR